MQDARGAVRTPLDQGIILLLQQAQQPPLQLTAVARHAVLTGNLSNISLMCVGHSCKSLRGEGSGVLSRLKTNEMTLRSFRQKAGSNAFDEYR